MSDPTDSSRLTFPKSHPDELLQGAFGKYELARVLGSGASGTVYLAHDPIFDRDVALKILRPRSPNRSYDRERFLREARSITRINHQHTVSVFDVNEIDGRPYIAMEWMQGGSAQQAIDERGAIPWAEATRWLIDACEAVASAHEAGMLHRDIKPGNILIDDAGRAKLADFGLAKLLSDPADSTITYSGSPMGTPSFMSPEQCRSETLDESSDIYSLGATYFALLAGHPPYQADSPLGVMFAHCSSPVPEFSPGSSIPAPCGEIVRRAMQKNPAERFSSTREMRNALAELLGEPLQSPPRQRRPIARRLAWGLSAASLAAVIAFAWGWSSANKTILPPPPARESSTLPVSSLHPPAPPASPTPSTPVAETPEIFSNKVLVAQHKGQLNDLEFSPSGKYLFAAGSSGALAVWDPLQPEKTIRRLIDSDKTKSDKGRGLLALATLPRKSIVVVGGESPELLVWEYNKGKLLQRIPHTHGKVRCIDISPKGDLMMTAGDVGWNMWKITDDLTFTDQGPIQEGMLLVHSARFSSVQPVIAGVSGNGIISLRSLEYPSSNRSIEVGDQVISFAFGKTRCDFAYGLNRRYVFAGSSSPRVTTSQFRGLLSNPLSLEFSPTRRQLAIGGENGTILFVDLDTGQRIPFSVGEDSRILVIRFAPDGNSVALGLGTGKIYYVPLPVERFGPPTPKSELALDLLAVNLPSKEQISRPLESLRSIFTHGAETKP
jgi:serine/threonine protein kinase